ncbi:hypothetical protein [Arabiibacter massiliensis]|uniref:hypothetical protein n=1 Tax=Arabiibacter massiliensis TaxID=1870985 RepID=UPI0009BBDCA4|nr:hypothetical protein [Arabiibacter massiliensis]
METFVDLDALEHFDNKLHTYIDEMRGLLDGTSSRVKAASLSTRDAAVSGAVMDVEDSFKRIVDELNNLDAFSKSIGQKVLKYRKAESMGKKR